MERHEYISLATWARRKQQRLQALAEDSFDEQEPAIETAAAEAENQEPATEPLAA